MNKILKKTKLDLYNLLKKEPNVFGDTDEDNNIISFLGEIWDLDAIESIDKRYKKASEEFYQHLINNDDYSFDYLFKERLDLFSNEESFIKFIETIVSPKFRITEDEITRYLDLINPHLNKNNLILSLEDCNDEGLPIYKIRNQNNDDHPDLKNNILFYVDKSPTGRSDYAENHKLPENYPAFVIVSNNKWNDYDIWSSYDLFYYSENDDDPAQYIGEVKIIYKTEFITNKNIPDKFKELDFNFCSLGQGYKYYSKLKDLFDKEFDSILYALKDVAFFPTIQDNFERNDNFKKSLIRFDTAESLLRTAKYKIMGYDLSNLYSFNYTFKPAYSDKKIQIDFDFSDQGTIPNQIYAIIGKNGTGKTQLISSLPICISKHEKELFSPRIPLFSKIISVSYSMFDKFEIPRKSTDFNYHYCGIRKNKEENYTERGLVLRFHNAWKKIRDFGRIDKWQKILLTFIDEDLINLFLKKVDTGTSDEQELNKYSVDLKGFNEVKEKLSSGQMIMLYVITEIVANIRYNSLLLYDEPETHLHPNAITELMNTIYELVEEFQSYCIITTHSPLVIRELFSKNVYIIERDHNVPSIRKISMESFGENIGILTEEIFGNKGVAKQYKKIISKLVKSGKSYDEIVDMLEYDDIPLSLNARIYIKSLVN